MKNSGSFSQHCEFSLVTVCSCREIRIATALHRLFCSARCYWGKGENRLLSVQLPQDKWQAIFAWVEIIGTFSCESQWL